MPPTPPAPSEQHETPLQPYEQTQQTSATPLPIATPAVDHEGTSNTEPQRTPRIETQGAPRTALFDQPAVILPHRTRGQARRANAGLEAIVEMTPSHEHAYRISLRQALNEGPEERKEMARVAIREELEQLLDINAFKFIAFNAVPDQYRDRIVSSHMFLKEKYKPDGNFDRMKGRLVAGGHLIDVDTIGNTRAPTVNIANVRLMCAVAAQRRYRLMTADIKGAFLLAKVGENERQFMTLPKEIVKILLMFRSDLRQYVHTDGSMMVEVLVWLYGYPQSAERFYSHLSASLLRRGFTCSPGDKCVFTRGVGDNMVIACTHVDDILCIGMLSAVNRFKLELSQDYQVNIQEGDNHSYIGLVIKRHHDGSVRISQPGYRREILDRFAELISIGPVVTKTPCTNEIMLGNEEGANKIGKTKYAGVVMSLMFLARLTRPDLMFTCAVLATHSHDPDENHAEFAARALRYLRYSGNMEIVYRYSQEADFNVRMYADASHASHPDGKGHMCVVTMFSNGMIDYECSKIKLTTLSSTESEHMALCAAATKAVWLTDMLKFMRVPLNGPIRVYQDNTSTIWLTANEGNFARNKHVLVRRNYVKEQIVDNVIKVLYKPTAEMTADMGTKPLPEKTLRRHMANMGMVAAPEDARTQQLNRLTSQGGNSAQMPLSSQTSDQRTTQLRTG